MSSSWTMPLLVTHWENSLPSVPCLQSLLLALMFPSTHATFGLVSCPSRDGELTTLHVCIWLSGLFQIFQRKYLPIFWTHPFLRRCIFPTWSPHCSLLTRLMLSSSIIVLHHCIS